MTDDTDTDPRVVQVVLSRRVSDEESVSVSWRGDTWEAIKPSMQDALATLQAHMREHNEKVVMLYQSKIENLATLLQQKDNAINALESRLATLEERTNGAEFNFGDGKTDQG